MFYRVIDCRLWRLVALLTAVSCCCVQGRADDWPQLLGPQRNGISAETGLLAGTMVATAFMRLKEDVFATILRKYMDDLLIIERNPDGKERERYLNFFDCQQVGDRWWGEDARFCRLWTDLGGEIWIDPDIEFNHTGPKTYVGNYHEFLKKKPNA